MPPCIVTTAASSPIVSDTTMNGMSASCARKSTARQPSPPSSNGRSRRRPTGPLRPPRISRVPVTLVWTSNPCGTLRRSSTSEGISTRRTRRLVCGRQSDIDGHRQILSIHPRRRPTSSSFSRRRRLKTGQVVRDRRGARMGRTPAASEGSEEYQSSSGNRHDRCAGEQDCRYCDRRRMQRKIPTRINGRKE
jgi:hypothetical protein